MRSESQAVKSTALSMFVGTADGAIVQELINQINVYRRMSLSGLITSDCKGIINENWIIGERYGCCTHKYPSFKCLFLTLGSLNCSIVV